MKKAELIEKLNTIANLTKAKEMNGAVLELIDELGTVAVSDGLKLHHYVTIHELTKPDNENLPKQMIAVHEILAEQIGVGEKTTRKEIDTIMDENVDKLKTRQDPKRIYAFYQKRMEELGWIAREKVRA